MYSLPNVCRVLHPCSVNKMLKPELVRNKYDTLSKIYSTLQAICKTFICYIKNLKENETELM